MIQHNNFLLVGDLPEDATNFAVDSEYNYLCFDQKAEHLGMYQRTAIVHTEIPIDFPGNYSIVGMAKDLTQEQYFEIFGINDIELDYGLKLESTLILKTVV